MTNQFLWQGSKIIVFKTRLETYYLKSKGASSWFKMVQSQSEMTNRGPQAQK